MIKIIRKWFDKHQQYQFGQDDNGNLYCRDIKTSTNLILLDPLFKKKNKFYYKFINPQTQVIKLVER